ATPRDREFVRRRERRRGKALLPQRRKDAKTLRGSPAVFLCVFAPLREKFSSCPRLLDRSIHLRQLNKQPLERRFVLSLRHVRLASDQLFNLTFQPRTLFHQSAGRGSRRRFIDAQRVEVSSTRKQSFPGFNFIVPHAVAVVVDQRVFGRKPPGALVKIFG